MRVVIAGGGIGGMTAALALLKKGFEVELYEQAQEIKEVGAGIQISPNGNRVLDALGVFDTLKQLSCDPERKELRLWNSGEPWPLFDLGPLAIERYGYPYLTVYRPDLLDTLRQAVLAEDPHAIRLKSRVVGVSQDDTSASITLEDGTVVTGDVVVGADGWRSGIRDELWGPSAPEFSGMVAWRGLIPMENLPEELRSWVGTTWIGPRAHAVHYPLHGGKLMNFVATIEGKEWTAQGGNVHGTVEECLEDFAGWHENIQTLIKLSPSLMKWALVRGEPIPHWTKGRVTLMGDACHATLPFLAQGAVHSIEDGLVLARALEAYGSDPEKALLRYEHARIDRTSKMVRGATANTDRFHSPELATPESAKAYLEREWSVNPIADRYDWLYSYDATTVEI
ncbi:FAD-dependent monooxygenase [Nocardioides sp. zg-DK7169]|uniref:FAD-dependent monooxygenase n=1 Tax=Nocardioides sp. zg-DK7169 TaxID=2736600 RepID=UPI00155642FF|nr:FAD-dependent monooxygenase [Nocardioides sp. zg-DK7169]NPC97048.1 NAD(P)-binding protein [Nocardioides sp. zg-DK7169]